MSDRNIVSDTVNQRKRYPIKSLRKALSEIPVQDGERRPLPGRGRPAWTRRPG